MTVPERPDPAVETPSRRQPLSGLSQRLASTVVLAVLALGAAWLGGPWFVALWTIAAIGVMWEWTRLVAPLAWRPPAAVGATALAAAALLFVDERPAAALAVLAIAPVAAAAAGPAGRRGWTAMGCVYAAIVLAAPVLLRRDPEYGLVAILFLFAVVWPTDIFAYVVGRLVGGPKVMPAVSPKKTWSGAIGGMAAAVVAGIAVATWAGLDNRLVLGLIGLGLSIAAQVGDFAESAIKRRFGVKDTSRLIPGHGGLMDRLDGFLAAAFAGTVLGIARGGLHAPAQGLLIW